MKSRAIRLTILLAAVACGAVTAAEEGLTRIQSYKVNTTIESRFAQTSVVVDFVNERDCATIRGFTLQLPREARVTELVMEADNACVWNGQVQALEDAIEAFNETASEGKPAALLSAWDSTNYAVQVSLPPLGTTRLVVRYEELLRRQQHQVPFQIPLFPGLPVNELAMDLYVMEPDSGIAEFDIDSVALVGSINIVRGDKTASAHYELLETLDEDALPRLIRGYYDPGPLPEDGLLLSDGVCFMHLFNPSSLLDVGPLNRNIVFVIDVSGSMSGQKLSYAKAAFNAMIETLTENDYFSIQSFSDRGVEDSWGPAKATAQAKVNASAFVRDLDTIGGTNLNDAYLEGISQALATWEGEQYLPILMILTDGQATAGTTNSYEISRNVKDANEGERVKIFALAFGYGADLPLLLGISIQNGGLAVPIYEGYGDAVSQMEGFYNGELGTVLLSDVNVLLSSDSGFESETQTSFPVLAAGAEIVVRGLLSKEIEASESILSATTTANTATGPNTWNTELVLVPGDAVPIRECYQSFAHAKINELWNYRGAAMALGNELEDYIPFTQTQKTTHLRQTDLDIIDRIEAEALSLALDAGLVVPGLTAMVTGEPSCPAGADNYSESEELCYDGDAFDAAKDESENGAAGDAYAPGSPPTSGGGWISTSAGPSLHFSYRPAASVLSFMIVQAF